MGRMFCLGNVKRSIKSNCTVSQVQVVLKSEVALAGGRLRRLAKVVDKPAHNKIQSKAMTYLLGDVSAG